MMCMREGHSVNAVHGGGGGGFCKHYALEGPQVRAATVSELTTNVS